MLRWFANLCQRSLRFRRLIIFIFMITTGLLYVLVEHYTLTTNHIESLSINPEVNYCEFKNETIRAINLASSEYCKEKLKDISCRIDSDPDFFPKSLPRFCPIQKGNFGDVIGCVSIDNISTYHLKRVEVFDNDIMCIDYCLKNTVSFAEYNDLTGQCFCSSNSDNQHRLMAANHKCKELNLNKDGLTNNSATLYRTGFIDFGDRLKKNPQTPITLVFFLTVGGRKNFRQIKRLLRSIYSPEHYYLIHVDSHEEYLYEEIKFLSKRISNIHLTNQRYPTTWGSSTLLNAHLEAFKQIFEELKWNFSFILNLSESDFPLKPVQVLTQFLSMYTSSNFLRSHNREPFKFIKSQGMFHTFIQCNDYMYRIGPRPLIQNIVYDGGSDWYVLNREFVYYVTYGNDELVNGLRHVFNYSLLPCEAFFHTVLINSIYCDTYIRNNLRFVHWNRNRGCNCVHKNVVDWCGCSPMVYRNVDKTILNNTFDKPLFFARKFDSTIDETILDWLDEKISRQDLSDGAFYLQNIYHINDSLTNLLKFFDSYVRTILIEYRQYRHDCFRDDLFQLEQIHSIFHLNIFQGYSLQYQINDEEKYELFIKLNSPLAIHSNQIKRFEIGVELDIKEMVFIDRSRTFIQPKLIKILIEWDDITNDNTSLVIHSPNGDVLRRVTILPSKDLKIIDISFPEISTLNMFGIWQMSIVEENNENLIASSNFLVLLSNEEQLFSSEQLKIISNFWSIVDMCSTTTNSSQCQDLSNEKMIMKISAINNCFQQRWSFFFYDIKSDW